MVAQAALFAGHPSGFLDALSHDKSRFTDTGGLDGVVHSLQLDLVFYLAVAGKKTEGEQAGEQKFPHGQKIGLTGGVQNRAGIVLNIQKRVSFPESIYFAV